MEHRGIIINQENNAKFTAQAVKLLQNYYMIEEDAGCPQKALARAATAYCSAPDAPFPDVELAQRIYTYASNHWFMFASPVLSNAPAWGEKPRGLPISCFLTYVDDSIDGLNNHTIEERLLSVKGGGVGGHWSDVRAVNGVAPGPMPFLKTVDADMVAYRQGVTRKGSYAAYMDISHPDILTFLSMRAPTGGDVNSKCFNLHHAVNITDAFMLAVKSGDTWTLKCPHSGEVYDTYEARELWHRILEMRYRTGEPYLNFIDEANRNLPQPLKDAGLRINGSNLCQEIHLPTAKDRTAVCCLSSVNLEYYDEWKDTNMVADLIRFLDNVLEYFITNAKDSLPSAVHSAERERSLGLGAMGFHSYLQKKNVAFESPIAQAFNKNIFRGIQEKAKLSTRALGKERGVYRDGEGVAKERNSHLMAVAPNANNSIILGTSPSIEPWRANQYTHRTRVGTDIITNKALERRLQELGQDSEEVWDSIEECEGSVQHLEFLTEHDKEVFKTAVELDQRWVIQHAADRQQYICQGQSVNLFFPRDADKAYLNRVHLDAWESKLKGLYYLRTEAQNKVEHVNKKIERKALQDFDDCIGCSG